MNTSAPAVWTQVSHDDTVSEVVATPSNGDRFALAMEVTSRSCRIAGKIDAFHKQVGLLIRW